MNKVGIHELILIESEKEERQRERERHRDTERRRQRDKAGGQGRIEMTKLFFNNRMPPNKYRRNDRIRKFGNPHGNNDLSLETSMDAKTSE